jgi:hypothetical protein
VIKIAIAGIALLLLQLISTAAEASLLRLYWINGFGSWFGYAPVEVDGKEAGTIRAGGQLNITVAPGAHTVRIHIPLSFEQAKTTVNVDQDAEQNLKVSRDLDGIAVGPSLAMPLFTLNLKAVPKAVAAAEISREELRPPEIAIPGKPVKKASKMRWSPGANR